jgi:hypothetical protein
MILDDDAQRGLLLQIVNHTATQSVPDASDRALAQLQALVALRRAIEAATIEAPA